MMKLNSRHLKCIELLVYTEMTNIQIAAELDINKSTITGWLKDEDFRNELNEEVHRKFSRLAVKAQKKLENLIDSPNDNVSLGAVKEALSKAGFDPTIKTENTNKEITVEIKD